MGLEDITISSGKASIFTTMTEDIESVFKTEEEKEKVRKMLKEAEEQSAGKQIKAIRKHDPLKKFLNLWWMRLRYGLHLSKPGYVWRIIRNVFTGKMYHLLGMKKYVLRGIEFAISFRCNFNCNHCLCARIDESKTRRELDARDYERVVKEAMALGATTFGMEGGEPFVIKNWEELMKAWQPKVNHIIISTNGFLFDEDKARKCAEIGVDTINFSIDSGYPELHDLFRKKRGSFARIMEGIKLCRKYGIKPLINTCVHKGNLYTDGFRELLEFSERERILINTLLAKGTGNFSNKEVMLDEQDLKAYEEIVKPYTFVQRHLNFNYGKQWGCPGTKEMINMTPYGDVMNCANMHIYGGNVMDEPLGVIRERVLKTTPFGRYHSCFLAEDKDFCEIYYNLLRDKSHVTIDEFRAAVFEYEKKHNKILYPELHEC